MSLPAVSSEREGEVTVVRFAAPVELVSSTARDLRGALQEAVADARQVVLDLGQVGFVDSAGVAALVGLERTLRGREGELRLAQPSREVTSVLKLLRLHRLFEIYPTVEAAVAAFAGA